MKCSFSGEEVPTEKLFVLYYPPSMAHQGWDQSVYAAARAKNALQAAIDGLKSFHGRNVVGKKLVLNILVLAAGLALFGVWFAFGVANWATAGFGLKYLLPLVGLALTGYGFLQLRAFMRRRALWQKSGASIGIARDRSRNQQAAPGSAG
jgi:hypothetical protein